MIIRSLFLTVVITIVASANCLAMTFDKSTALGSIATFSPSGAFKIEGAASNQGELSKDKEYKSGRGYSKGVATFGSGEDVLYVYYDNSYVNTEDFMENVFRSKELAKSCLMGGSDINNTIILPMGFPHTCSIYQISNDMGLSMYLLEYDKGAVPSYKMIGKRKDGNWVKYFETVAAEQYYGMRLAFCHNFYLKDNMIVFEYGRYDSKEKKFINSVELQFIWNEADQWFGLDQKVYVYEDKNSNEEDDSSDKITEENLDDNVE